MKSGFQSEKLDETIIDFDNHVGHQLPNIGGGLSDTRPDR